MSDEDYESGIGSDSEDEYSDDPELTIAEDRHERRTSSKPKPKSSRKNPPKKNPSKPPTTKKSPGRPPLYTFTDEDKELIVEGVRQYGPLCLQWHQGALLCRQARGDWCHDQEASGWADHVTSQERS